MRLPALRPVEAGESTSTAYLVMGLQMLTESIVLLVMRPMPPAMKGCILFVPADHRPNGGVAQGIEYFVDLGARHSKYIFCVPRLEPFDQYIRTGLGCSASCAFILISPFGLTTQLF